MEHSIAVVIPLYNHERFIGIAIESVLQQTRQPDEIIVVNDGSTDHSDAVMQDLVRAHPQIHYFSQNNQGAHAALNGAVAKATSHYIAILNSDDAYHPERLAVCLQRLQAEPEVEMVATTIQGLDEQGNSLELTWCNFYKQRYVASEDLFTTLVDGNFFFTTSNIFIKKSIFAEVGGFANFRYAHDLDFFLRLITHQKTIAFIDQPLLMYRIHGSNTISEDYAKVFLERDAIVALHIYARLTQGTLLGLEPEQLKRLIARLTESGRLETVFYDVCQYLQQQLPSLDPNSLARLGIPNPGFYTDSANPPDAFIRREQASQAVGLAATMAAIEVESAPRPDSRMEATEFHRLAQIAVAKTDAKLQSYPLLASALVRIMHSAWGGYRRLRSGNLRRGWSRRYAKIHWVLNRFQLPGDAQKTLAATTADDGSPMQRIERRGPVLFISHDAGRTGAPIVLLNLLRWLKEKTTLDFRIVLRGGGELTEQFAVLAPTLSLSQYRPAEWREALYRFMQDSGGGVSLIYSNTAVNGDVLDHLKSLVDAPVISAIHELESSIQRFAPGQLFAWVKQYTDCFVAVSGAVQQNLEWNHAIPEQKIKLIHSFIPADEILALASGQAPILDSELEEREDRFVVGGSGTVDWRKGADLFIQSALLFLKKLTPEQQRRVQFVWVGGDLDSVEMAHLRHDIQRSALLRGRVIFTGTQDQATPYFSRFTAFLLSSREDPFPLVCLEAGVLEKPVICFAQAGGIPDLIADDAGFVVPYLDTEAVAQALHCWLVDPDLRQRMGRNLAEKVRKRHDVAVSAPEILALIQRYAALETARP